MKKKSDVRTLLCYIKGVFSYILDFIWPQFCLGCNREGSLCCGFCLNDILLDDLKTISWPDKNKLYFEACYNCCNYQNKLVQKLIKNYKYNYLENLADLLVNILEKQARRLNLDKDTIIVNAPLHKNKKRQRGFDQTEILAKKLAKRLSLDYSPLLIRTKNNPAQAKLDKTARQKNVVNIFSLNPSTMLRAYGKNTTNKKLTILLIDDVVTTGATLNQAAKVLKENNFGKIICLVLAKNKNTA
ncbi:MAG: ComF family protein [Candidatus Komeilibacteria bacterium]|jgi:competence protein ComFC|nr:ComF family protein [Candidatus Komeilibacteria bacterium]MBT4447961.1 ComF family protein [Candidatus Komeilibacteria bacterium]